MAVTLTDRPPTGLFTAGNPVFYAGIRKDFATLSLTNNAGKIQVTVTGDITSQITVGDLMWLKSDNGLYDLLVSVSSRSYGAPNTTIVFNEAYTVAATTGYINLFSRKQYHVEVGVFDGVTNLALLNGVTFIYAPDSKGNLKIDLTAAIKSLLNPDIGIDLTAHVWNLDTASKNFYIKYKENWIGSANAYVDDVANKRTAVYGASQIGSASSQVAQNTIPGGLYHLKQFADVYGLSFYKDGNSNRRLKFLQDGVAYYTNEMPAATGIYNCFIPLFSQHLNSQSGVSTAWTMLANGYWRAAAGVDPSNEGYYVTQIDDGKKATFNFKLANTSGDPYNFVVKFYSAANTLLGTHTTGYFDASTGSGDYTFEFSNSSGQEVRYVGVTLNAQYSGPGGGSGVDVLISSVFKESFVACWLVSLASKSADDAELVNLGNVIIEASAENERLLVWKNLSGGISSFVFDYAHELYNSFDETQSPRLNLFADNIVIEQYNLINTVNSPGDVYRVNYDKISSSVNKSHKKVGQQVYIVSNRQVFGVVVIPTQSKTNTKKLRHKIAVTIELPEIITI